MTKEQEKLVTANMGYVITLARQYKSDVLSTDDLIRMIVKSRRYLCM